MPKKNHPMILRVKPQDQKKDDRRHIAVFPHFAWGYLEPCSFLNDLHWFIGIRSQSNGRHANELQKCSQSQMCRHFAGFFFFSFVSFLSSWFQYRCFLSSFFKKYSSSTSPYRPHSGPWRNILCVYVSEGFPLLRDLPVSKHGRLSHVFITPHYCDTASVMAGVIAIGLLGVLFLLDMSKNHDLSLTPDSLSKDFYFSFPFLRRVTDRSSSGPVHVGDEDLM